MCFFIKLGIHASHSERMDPIHFGSQRFKVKVTMDIYNNKLVNMIETKPLYASSSNLADMLVIVRGWTLLILEVTGQRSRSQLTCMEMVGWLVVLRIYIALAIFQPYRDLKAGDNQSLKS